MSLISVMIPLLSFLHSHPHGYPRFTNVHNTTPLRDRYITFKRVFQCVRPDVRSARTTQLEPQSPAFSTSATLAM